MKLPLCHNNVDMLNVTAVLGYNPDPYILYYYDNLYKFQCYCNKDWVSSGFQPLYENCMSSICLMYSDVNVSRTGYYSDPFMSDVSVLLGVGLTQKNNISLT